ncbi:hypothetical protein SAMN02745136_01599 [Anaerocolumna jejuensis DSM 15929]|uniref:Uncharacterized protein n=1 Tax=Anaerocolumna jejuensis DSM 15929 TaxID=1121322 RepID=A0A1M6PHJ2_9FIRM|nr:hypothetical protein [Anaerocolumna jejuensis]SHK07384.1 hypothetical protein SAMN02745136_01599 [Anaerocolumna jejuensis DSM 15929]
MKLMKKIYEKLGIENIINIIGHFLTLVSLLLVFITLLEMKIQRNNTYMPQIVAESNEKIEMSWDSKSDFIFLKEDTNMYNQIYLNIYNVGVGVARNLEFAWDKDNVSVLANYINKNSVDFSISLINEMMVIKTTGIEVGGLGLERISKLNFLAPNVDEPYKVNLPIQYIQLYKIMLIEQINNYPPIQLKVSYTDIQGKEYEQVLTLTIKPDILLSSSGNESDDYTGMAELDVVIY